MTSLIAPNVHTCSRELLNNFYSTNRDCESNETKVPRTSLRSCDKVHEMKFTVPVKAMKEELIKATASNMDARDTLRNKLQV